MAVATEERTDAQHRQTMQALARANGIRIARAQLKQRILRGSLSVVAVIREVPTEAENMTLTELLGAQKRWGAGRAKKLLVPIDLREYKTVGSLTDRQKRVLIEALEAKLAEG